MVKKSVLDRFVKLGGYNIVKLKKGKWKNISLASKRTGISRPTIYTILKKYPEAPSKVMPKYVEEFKETEGYRQLKQKYGKRDFWKNLIRVIREGWLFLQKKDPITWINKDFSKLWEEWHDPTVDTIRKDRGLEYRRLMTILPEGTKYREQFKTKMPKPAKAYWYLTEPEIFSLIDVIDRADLLTFFIFGLHTGSRRSAVVTATPEKMDFLKWKAIVHEKKVKKDVAKYLTESFMKFLDRYIRDFNIKPTQRLFPLDAETYNQMLKVYGKKAGIRKVVTTHILKHTYVQQSHEHGVPAEVVVQQSGTELRTLQKWYSFVKEEKIQKHMQGKEWNPEPFTDFIDRIVAHATRRYEQIS